MKTNNGGIPAAIDWIMDHGDEVEDEIEGDEKNEGNDTPAEDASAKSLKCDDCGKQFRSATEAEAHAIRTKHANFSESTEEVRALTKEEKEAQLARLQVSLPFSIIVQLVPHFGKYFF